jgi:hypothetical protein
MAVVELASLQLDQKTKDDIDALLQAARVVRFYARAIAANVMLKGQAKHDLKVLFNACNSWLKTIEARSTNQAAFDSRFDVEIESWAIIVQALTHMKPDQVEGVERFCEGIVNGSISVQLSGPEKRNITINSEPL